MEGKSMKKYHVEILSPVEIIAENVPARSGRDAAERIAHSAGFTGLRYCWTQRSPVDYPPGKRPACPVFQADNGDFIHAIAWTE
jgi:hypothetical protein